MRHAVHQLDALHCRWKIYMLHCGCTMACPAWLLSVAACCNMLRMLLATERSWPARCNWCSMLQLVVAPWCAVSGVGTNERTEPDDGQRSAADRFGLCVCSLSWRRGSTCCCSTCAAPFLSVPFRSAPLRIPAYGWRFPRAGWSVWRGWLCGGVEAAAGLGGGCGGGWGGGRCALLLPLVPCWAMPGYGGGVGDGRAANQRAWVARTTERHTPCCDRPRSAHRAICVAAGQPWGAALADDGARRDRGRDAAVVARGRRHGACNAELSEGHRTHAVRVHDTLKHA